MDWLKTAKEEKKSSPDSKKTPEGKKKKGKKASQLIGTSGFSYNHWKGNFYPPKMLQRQYLPYYALNFPTLEMSSTYHGSPQEQEVKAWMRKTPHKFIFSLRGPKAITHKQRLEHASAPMKTFVKAVEPLGSRLGAITFQLPEDLTINERLLDKFLKSLPSGPHYSMEFRNETWHKDGVYSILNKHDVALVTVGFKDMPVHKVQPASWSYARLSGNKPFQKNIYTDAEIEAWVETLSDQPKPLLVYFNNEYQGFAAKNAKDMMKRFNCHWNPMHFGDGGEARIVYPSWVGNEAPQGGLQNSPDHSGTPVTDNALGANPMNATTDAGMDIFSYDPWGTEIFDYYFPHAPGPVESNP